MANLILALDVSTAIVGWALLPEGSIPGAAPTEFSAIDLRKVKGDIWSKADILRAGIDNVVRDAQGRGHRIVKLCIENPLQRLRRGMSSAATIALLARFNALASYFARSATGIEPLYIDATAARKKIGVPLMSKKASGIDQKLQTFNFLNETVFKGHPWPLKRGGNVQDHCFDMCDAYVIALAGAMGLGEPA